MKVTKNSLGAVVTHSTIKYESIPVYLTFENDDEMDVVTLNIHYEDTDMEKVLTCFTFDKDKRTYLIDTVSVDVCDYLNDRISEKIHGCSAIRTNFEITDELCEYIDNIIDEAMKKRGITE